jgi:hypothetical protein
MRTLISGLVAAGILCGQASATTTQCARPAEKSAFDVAGLKSQLMVTALSCAAQDKYNAFITRFRLNLVAQDRALTAYFGRTYGRRGQAQHDDYVTSLANQQSEEGTKLGDGFCQHNVAMFDEVMALPSPTALPTYAAGKSLAQPIALVTCPVVVKRTIRHTSASTTKKKPALRS